MSRMCKAQHYSPGCIVFMLHKPMVGERNQLLGVKHPIPNITILSVCDEKTKPNDLIEGYHEYGVGLKYAHYMKHVRRKGEETSL